MLPEARTTGLLSEHVGDETVVFDLNSKEVHRLSPLAAAVFSCCDGRTDLDRIAGLAEERLGEPVVVDDVEAAVAQLRERSLLEAPPILVKQGLSRRDLMKKSAITGAAVAAIPLISSIAAPAAQAAVSGIPTGCTGCRVPPDCVSKHCCQDVPGHACNQSCCVGENNSCQIDANNNCTVVLAGCGSVVCPPGTSKCCTTLP